MDKYIYSTLTLYKRIFVCVVLYFLSDDINAQTIIDTTKAQQLPAADIISKNYKISETGIKTFNPDSALKYINNYKDLSDIINLNSAAYLKNYGNGALSTVSFRGTGAEHTNVLWNGFQLNNSALGLTDLSNLTSNFGEKITLLAGGNATSAGSGAIGGTVVIDQNFERKDMVNFIGNYNSIGGYTSALNTNFGNKKLIINLGILYRDNVNNFTFINPFKPGMPKEKMPDCSLSKKTYNSSALFKINKNASIKFLSLVNIYTINIQPPIGIDIAQGKRSGYNMVSGFHLDFRSKLGITQVKTGLLNQDETYDARSINNTYSRTIILQWQNSFEHFFNPIKGEHKISIAVDHQYIKGAQTNYELIHKENRTALMFRYKVNPTKKLEISANVREQFYTFSKPFFSPFVGLQYMMLQKYKNTLLVKSNATKGFRLPTFNERYYQPGGNINIKPENTKQFEVGLVYKYMGKKFKHDLEFTYYYNNMYNRVVWINLNSPVYLEPINLRETKINGLEFIYTTAAKYKKVDIKSHFNLGYTQSLNVISNPVFSSRVDYKQMIYIPPFKVNWWTEFKYNKTSIIYLLQQTSLRYTNLDNTDWLQSYLIQNIYLQNIFKVKQAEFIGSLKLINLANAYYQTLQNYALPGRYFEISIILNIKQIK